VDIAAKIIENLDLLTTETDGVCDLCGQPIEDHPCPEHRLARMAAQTDAQIAEAAEAWGVALPEGGRV
jgi:hypothetical protein